MKNIYFILVVLISVVSFAQQSSGIEFETKIGDYGDLKFGAPAECEFFFKNTSGKNVEIKSVKSNTRALSFIVRDSIIKPGQRSSIVIIYNTDEVGPIRKTITVFNTGSPNVHTLSIRGRVLDKTD